MASSKRAVKSARLRLPEVLDGRYTGLLIGTYGAQLAFGERQLFRHVARTAVNRIVLADGGQLARYLVGATDVRRMNRSYVAAPVTSPRAHHPKYLLLAGPEAGVLIVGSGNLSVDGYTGPGESFATYRWSTDAPEQEPAFAAVRHLVEGLRTRGWIDLVAAKRVEDLFKAAPWISAGPVPTGPVRHNLDRPMLDQFVDAIGDRKVVSLVASAPFHDKGARALRRMLAAIRPGQFTLLVQSEQTRLDAPAAASAVSSANVPFELLEASAPKPYRPTLLHAKFYLARTDDGDVLLLGSPNLSTVALTEFGEHANVEIANLLDGPSGAFDSLLTAIELTPISNGLEGFAPAAFDDEDEDELEPVFADTVRWSPPRLEGRLRVPVPSGSVLRVLTGARPIDPVRSTFTSDPEGANHFALDFSDVDAGVIDRSREIRLQIGNETSASIRPYHLQTLLRLTSTGHRVDLLQEVGALDLSDQELEQLLAELDRVLIIDGRSVWRVAHPEAPPTPENSEAPHVEYGDLDWEKIGEAVGYPKPGTGIGLHRLAPTELGMVLQSLTDRFRAEVRRGLGLGDDTVDDEPDDLDVEQESEDEATLEEADEASGDEDVEPRRLSANARVRRLWRNFVRRFVNGLADEEFVAAVGSNIVIPGYVVFNHLCRRLRVVDMVDPDYLTEVQCALWTFMWGQGGEPGYLDTLTPSERVAAAAFLDEHEHLPAMLAAVDDAYWHAEGIPDLEPELRDTWRGFLENEHWTSAPGALPAAAAVGMYVDGSVEQVADDMTELAEITYTSELTVEVATQLGISPNSLEDDEADVNIGHIEFYRITDPTYRLTADRAGAAISAWKNSEADRTYFRIAATNAVAVIDTEAGEGFFYAHDTGEEEPLGLVLPVAPRWRKRLKDLLGAAA